MPRNALIEALPRSGSGLLPMLPIYYKHISGSSLGPLQTVITAGNTFTYDHLSSIPNNYLIEIRGTLNLDNSALATTGSRKITALLKFSDGGVTKATFRSHLTDIDASAETDYSAIPISYVVPKPDITKIILECYANVADVISCQLELDILAYPAGELIELS